MNRNNLKWLIVSTLVGLTVSLEVKCDDPTNQLACTCISPNNIEWFKNGLSLSSCVSGGSCIPSSVGDNTFATSGNNYTINVNPFDDSLCGNYACKDSTTLESIAFPTCAEPTTQATCTCDNKDAICECKTGMIVFTAINYVLDIVYFGIMVWLTLGIRALAKYAPQGNFWKSVIIGCATSATIFLDIGLTINLFLNVESAEECCCSDGSNCGEGLRVALAVVGWLLSCPGFVLLIRHIARGGCGGQTDLPPINDEPKNKPKKPEATVSPTRKPVQKGTGHALGDMKNNDVSENGSKGGQPQPIPPREDSASEVSRKDVDIEVTRRPLPPVGGGMGQRGLSANFGNDGDLTPADGAPSNRLPPMQHISENDETEKKKKKKKKKRKEAETNEEEDEE